ncbi:hypothetical protein D3C71_1918010 [compost metagenome]
MRCRVLVPSHQHRDVIRAQVVEGKPLAARDLDPIHHNLRHNALKHCLVHGCPLRFVNTNMDSGMADLPSRRKGSWIWIRPLNERRRFSLHQAKTVEEVGAIA